MQNGVFILEANNVLSSQAGIRENTSDQLTVCTYPNPVYDQLMISMKNSEACAITMQLKSMQGQLLLSEQWNDASQNNFTNRSIEVSALPSGMYILSISAGKKITQRKVVISH